MNMPRNRQLRFTSAYCRDTKGFSPFLKHLCTLLTQSDEVVPVREIHQERISHNGLHRRSNGLFQGHQIFRKLAGFFVTINKMHTFPTPLQIKPL